MTGQIDRESTAWRAIIDLLAEIVVEHELVGAHLSSSPTSLPETINTVEIGA